MSLGILFFNANGDGDVDLGIVSEAIIFDLNGDVVGGCGPFEFGVSMYKGPSIVLQDFASHQASAVIWAH